MIFMLLRCLNDVVSSSRLGHFVARELSVGVVVAEQNSRE